MKKLFGIFMVLVVCIFLATGANAAIVGSAHDFQNDAWSGGEICIACHTPHHADTSIATAPLWNRELSGVVSYTLYSSATLTATMGQPAGISKLCLSCHDGTVALENFGGVTTGTTYVVNNVNGNFVIGGGADLSDHHPVSFTYDTALSGVDLELHDPSATTSGLGGNIDADMLFGAGNNQLECSSCHDVHRVTGVPKLLLKSNAASALCLTCHDK